MTKQNLEEIYQLHNEICRPLGDPKRIMLLNYLRDGPKTVGEMVEELELKQANVSQHLAILRHSLLVRTKREGSNIFYELADERIISVLDLLREILRGQLDQKRRIHDRYFDAT